MNSSRTEQWSAQYTGLDQWSPEDVLDAIVRAQSGSVAAISAANSDIAEASRIAAEAWRRGGRLIYAGAGSSGLIAQIDALELPGTFGLEETRILVLLAGGRDTLSRLDNAAEDDRSAAGRDVASANINSGDVLVGISASGRTPYTVQAISAAREYGATTIGIACNRASPLLEVCDHQIYLESHPEVVAGSTRMNAGTAQKCALNMLSTLMAVELGHVYDGMMINLRAENEKLKTRAIDIVSQAANIHADAARDYLAKSRGSIKCAILLAAGARSRQQAEFLLESERGHVRKALRRLSNSKLESPESNEIRE